MPGNKVTLKGSWCINSHTVTYETQGPAPKGFTLPTEETYNYNDPVTVAAVPAVYEGYTFTGWTVTGATVTGGGFAMPDNNVVISGVWTKNAEPEPHTVTFTYKNAPEGLTPPKGGSILPGDDVHIPAAPAHEGYNFLGWTLNGEPVSGTITMPERDIEITGAWEEVTPESEPEPLPLPDAYYVTYVYTGSVPAGAPALPVLNAYFAGATVNVAAAPQMAGYVFSGWTTQDATIENGAFKVFYRHVQLVGSWTAVGAAGVPQTGDMPSFLAPLLMLAGVAGMLLPLRRRLFKGDK